MPTARRRSRDYYSVSVDTLRVLLWIALLAGLAVLGFFVYRYWQDYAVERRAAETLDRSRALLEELRRSDQLHLFQEAYDDGRAILTEARESFDDGDYATAFALGDKARTILEEAVLAGRDQAYAELGLVEGDVQVRRADESQFERARNRQRLRPGDYVRTTRGTAQILFRGGRTPMILGPDALFRLPTEEGSGGGATSFLQYGWVRVSSSSLPSAVATEEAEIRVASNSEATVAWDRERRRGDVRVRRGDATVRDVATGREVAVSASQEVTLREGRVADPVDLAPEPELEAPPDRFRVSLNEAEQVVLAWAPVNGASRFKLEIADNPLFNDPFYSVERSGTTATLALQEERLIYWRVASIDRRKKQGPWSDVRTFRITSEGRLQISDTDPPALDVDAPLTSGNIVILEGRTEPGATLEVNGRPISVRADGRFRQVVEIRDLQTSAASTDSRRLRLLFRAADPAGNVTEDSTYTIPLPPD